MQYFIFFSLILISVTSLGSEKVDDILRNAVVKKFETSIAVKKAVEETCAAAPLKTQEPSITLLHNHTLDFSNSYEPILIIQEYKCGSRSDHIAALIPTNIRYNPSKKIYEYGLKSPEVVSLTYKKI